MRGQSSLEYVLLLSALLLILIVIYTLSNGMDLRRQLITSQMEGARATQVLGRAIDSVVLAGPGTSSSISVVTFPNQTIIVSGAEVLALGPSNRTLAITHTLSNLTEYNQFTASGNVQIYYNGTNVSVQYLG